MSKSTTGNRPSGKDDEDAFLARIPRPLREIRTQIDPSTSEEDSLFGLVSPNKKATPPREEVEDDILESSLKRPCREIDLMKESRELARKRNVIDLSNSDDEADDELDYGLPPSLDESEY